jgi:hypothetical protein
VGGDEVSDGSKQSVAAVQAVIRLAELGKQWSECGSIALGNDLRR